MSTRERGDVWLASLDPRHGTEPGKTRPVLIVQAKALLDAGHPSTLVVPLTTRLVDDAESRRQAASGVNPICWSTSCARSTTAG